MEATRGLGWGGTSVGSETRAATQGLRTFVPGSRLVIRG